MQTWDCFWFFGFVLISCAVVSLDLLHLRNNRSMCVCFWIAEPPVPFPTPLQEEFVLFSSVNFALIFSPWGIHMKRVMIKVPPTVISQISTFLRHCFSIWFCWQCFSWGYSAVWSQFHLWKRQHMDWNAHSQRATKTKIQTPTCKWNFLVSTCQDDEKNCSSFNPSNLCGGSSSNSV